LLQLFNTGVEGLVRDHVSLQQRGQQPLIDGLAESCFHPSD
jgi:hypothetical protein